MTISAELQRIYASAPVNVTWYDAIYMTHPSWPTPIAYITNTIEERTFNLYGESVTFIPASFAVVLPTRDDLGVVDFTITFPVTASVVDLLNLAEGSGVAIETTLTTYIDGPSDPQMEPIKLYMDNVSMTNDKGTGTAKRVDLINRTYPRNIVRALTYPGLLR